jgi:hypothetical protein
VKTSNLTIKIWLAHTERRRHIINIYTILVGKLQTKKRSEGRIILKWMLEKSVKTWTDCEGRGALWIRQISPEMCFLTCGVNINFERKPHHCDDCSLDDCHHVLPLNKIYGYLCYVADFSNSNLIRLCGICFVQSNCRTYILRSRCDRLDCDNV